ALVFILCNQEIGGPGVPSRAEIAARMEDQRRSMLSRRYLRDLRREAVIEIRGEARAENPQSPDAAQDDQTPDVQAADVQDENSGDDPSGAENIEAADAGAANP